jgi:hypothetical protein
MKKLFLLFFWLLLMFSCKKELPSNIKDAADRVNYFVSYHQKFDSMIVNIDTTSICKLDRDSLYTLYFISENNIKNYKESVLKLEELLKYNPEYSDYDEIKNIKTPFRDKITPNTNIEDANPYCRNMSKIFTRLLKVDYNSATFLYDQFKN